jgi:hypothetical protein
MKKIVLLFAFTTTFFIANAQTKNDDVDESTSFFKKENLFTGGSVGASFGSGYTSLSAGPYFGYSLNKYVDVAAALNYNYLSVRDLNSTLKGRKSIIGPGAFVRVYPVKFLFVQAQFEYNFIKYRTIYGVAGYPDDIEKYKAPSFLIGAGYTSGREESGDPYYFFSVFVDLSKNIYSPYKDNYGRQVAIIRTGINIPLFQGKR